jgi:uncharacterized LabA/DUF88 family protein
MAKQNDKVAEVPFYKEEKTAVFIDGSNLYAAARSLEFDIDYRLLLQWVASHSRLVRASYYTVLPDDQEYSPIRPLVDWLDYNGYKMVTKPAKEFTDNQGRRKIKGSIDIELAIDMIEIAPCVDHIMLFSGDGDFKRLIEAVQKKGVRVTVISTIKSTPPMVADELRRQADHFLDLDDLAQHIMREHVPGDDDGEGDDDGGNKNETLFKKTTAAAKSGYAN